MIDKILESNFNRLDELYDVITEGTPGGITDKFLKCIHWCQDEFIQYNFLRPI